NETHLTQKGLFSLGAQADDAESSIKNCYAQAYSTIADYTDNNPLANQSMNLNTGFYNANGTLDLRRQDGNYTLAVACRDQAGNLDRNRTLHMPNSKTTHWFPFDDSGPVIDEDTTSPPNASYTAQQDPIISFNVTDFSHIDGASVTVWFNTTKYSFSTSTANFSHWASWNSNSTMYFEIDPGYQLTANHSYEIKLIASDSAGDQTQNQTYWFHTDFTPPSITSIENVTSSSQTLSRGSTTWHHETVDLNVTCTDTASFPDQLSLTGSSGSGETVQPTGNEATLSFTASSGTEKTHNLTITCTDAAGNTQRKYRTYAIDNDRPEIDQQIPSPGASLSASLPYEQPIILRVVDSGVGFNTNAANPNPQFDGSSVSSYNSSISSDQTQYNINWSQSISSNGTHTVSLNSGSALDISDRFGETVSVSSWEFKISDSGETVSTASTTSNASLTV
ncbi:MAG: hypothetical protein SVU32_01085, partial [Candidatus Nanohaloarchaea archaeon]|nr:hypothetical protein [Candidatus Nanohaloarchaea archaeon]